MLDYINLKTKIQLGKNSNIKSTKNKDIDKLETIKIDKNQSKQDRMINFLNTVKNPYMFLINGTKVKFEFTNKGLEINECIENIIKNKIL